MRRRERGRCPEVGAGRGSPASGWKRGQRWRGLRLRDWEAGQGRGLRVFRCGNWRGWAVEAGWGVLRREGVGVLGFVSDAVF